MTPTLRAKTGVTPETGEFLETKAVVRTRACTGSVESVPTLLGILTREKFTGKVIVEMSQGGIRRMSAEDRQAIGG